MGVRAAILALILLLPAGLDAGLFEVGPGKALATPGDIQWESINPGISSTYIGVKNLT